MQNNTNQSCQHKCKGSKKLDPNAIKLEESTVEFIKVKNKEDTHFCFDAIELPMEEISLNTKIGLTLLENNDKLIISTKESISNQLELSEKFLSNECIMEDGNYYTVISKQ